MNSIQQQLGLSHNSAIENVLDVLVNRQLSEEHNPDGRKELCYCIELIESMRKLDKCKTKNK